MESIRSLKPAVPYVGGKRLLAATLVPLIQSFPHKVYAEPFVGAGGVFLRRNLVPKSEVINDGSRDIATFFRILRCHFPQFMDVLKFQITSREEFNRLCQVNPDTLTDLQRAARFLYLQALSYGGKVAGRSFGIDPRRGARFNVMVLENTLAELGERMAGVVIECLDAEEFVRRYDTEDTLFFADPPYFGTEDYYDQGLFQQESLWRIATTLKSIKGRFIATNLNVPAVLEAFKGCEIRTADVTYSVSGNGSSKTVAEVIIIGGSAHRI